MNDDKQVAGGVLSMDALLQHESFVRSVVRRLLSDEAAVQDVVQSTWVQAMEHPPEARHGQRSVAAWLARVATNLVHSRQRSEGRRSYREGAVAREERDDSWEESVERLESRQRVVEVVLTLDEPYRSVVMLRYEQGLSVEQVASKLQRSPGTIRSQLSRAHSTLRKRLDGEFGDRNSWALLAVPFGGAPWAAGAGDALSGAPSSASGTASNGAAAGLSQTAVGIPVAMAVVGIIGVSLLLAGLWHFSRPEDADEFATISSGQAVQEADPGGARLASIGAVLQGRDTVEETAPEAEAQVALWSGPPPETWLPTAQLLSRRKYGYTQATFSFEYGTRDDPGGIVRNDWDVLFSGKAFDVRTVTDDRSVIVDLGEIRLADVYPGLLDDAEQAEEVQPKLGHSYLVWTRDSGTDLVSAFEVVDLKLKESCELNWYTVNGNGQASGSFHDDGVGPPLVETMEALRHGFQANNVLTAPRIFLQARAGHQGGNPCRIDALGEVNAYFDGVSETRMEITDPIGRKTESLGFAEGGAIPAGMVFMVQRVTYRGADRDGQSGRGEFEIHIGGQSIVPKDYGKDLSLMVWTGSIPVRAGFETDVDLTVSYFTQGEALIEGVFMPDEGIPQAGELITNGMRLFPQVEIPEGQGLLFSSGEVLKPTRRGANPDMVFDGHGFRFWKARMHSLGESMLDQAVLDPLSEATLENSGPLQVGHCYLLAQPFLQTTFFRVEALNPGVSCTIDWFSINHQGQQVGSHSDTQEGVLASSIEGLRRASRKQLELKQAFVHLQLRVQSLGGNPCRVSMGGQSRGLELSTEALVVTGVPIHRNEEQSYWEGGLIPEGQIFVVSRVEYRVFRDLNGDGKKHPVRIRVGQTYVLAEKDLQGNLNNVWTGRVEVRPGGEASVYIEGTYNTAIDVKISGQLIPDPRARAH